MSSKDPKSSFNRPVSNAHNRRSGRNYDGYHDRHYGSRYGSERDFDERVPFLQNDIRNRGLDIIPQDDKAQCGATMAKKRFTPIIISAILLVIFAILLIVDLLGNRSLYIFYILLAALAGISAFSSYRTYSAFTSGKFDMYGGAIMHVGISRERKPASTNRSNSAKRGTTRQDEYIEHPYAIVNGITIPVSKSVYQSLGRHINDYYYVLRIKRFSSRNDEYYFLKADPSLENKRTGSCDPRSNR